MGKGTGYIAPCILNLGTRCLTCWLLYPWGRSPRYPLCRRLDGLQSQFGYGDEKKNPCPFQELNPNHPAHSLVNILTEILQLYILM
jgi:hypothetical protein